MSDQSAADPVGGEPHKTEGARASGRPPAGGVSFTDPAGRWQRGLERRIQSLQRLGSTFSPTAQPVAARSTSLPGTRPWTSAPHPLTQSRLWQIRSGFRHSGPREPSSSPTPMASAPKPCIRCHQFYEPAGCVARHDPARWAGMTVISDCPHTVQIRPVRPRASGCEDCLAAGRHDWVHLRMCETCGHVGCCDSSPGRHATAHFMISAHPIVQSMEKGEGWLWCYLDRAYLEI